MTMIIWYQRPEIDALHYSQLNEGLKDNLMEGPVVSSAGEKTS